MQSWKKKHRNKRKKDVGRRFGRLVSKTYLFQNFDFLKIISSGTQSKCYLHKVQSWWTSYISPIRMHKLKQGRKGVHVPKHFCMLQNNHTCSWTITANTSSLFSSSSIKSILTNILSHKTSLFRNTFFPWLHNPTNITFVKLCHKCGHI